MVSWHLVEIRVLVKVTVLVKAFVLFKVSVLVKIAILAKVPILVEAIVLNQIIVQPESTPGYDTHGWQIDAVDIFGHLVPVNARILHGLNQDL